MPIFEKSKSQQRREVVQKPPKPKYYYAMVKLPTASSDYWPAYQIEIVKFVENQLDRRWLWGKPDTKQMIMAKLQEFMEPDAEFEVEPEADDETHAFQA